MSAMSELHQDLSTIHAILLGQRRVAQIGAKCLGALVQPSAQAQIEAIEYRARVEAINDLLLEFEAAGIVWPDNVEELHHD